MRLTLKLKTVKQGNRQANYDENIASVEFETDSITFMVLDQR